MGKFLRSIRPLIILSPILNAATAEDVTQIPIGDPPVPDYVYASYIELYKDADPWFGEARVEAVLQALGFERGKSYGVRPTSDLANGIPMGAGVVIIPSNSFGILSSVDNVNSPAAQTALTSFVEDGGVLVVHLSDNLPNNGYQVPGLPAITTNGPITSTLFIETTDHVMVLGPDRVAGTADDLTPDNIQPTAVATLDRLPPFLAGTTTILSSEGHPALVEYPFGQGRVIASTIVLEFGDLGDPGVIGGSGTPWRLLFNELEYAIVEAPLPADPVILLQLLAAEVIALNLQSGIENSLDAKLDAVLSALEDVNDNNDQAAIHVLAAFVINVQNQMGVSISAEDGEALISAAESISALLQE